MCHLFVNTPSQSCTQVQDCAFSLFPNTTLHPYCRYVIITKKRRRLCEKNRNCIVCSSFIALSIMW